MGIEPISKTLQVFLAEALEHASPYSAGNQNRTDITDLKAGVITIIRYPHFVGEVGNDPTILCV